MIRVPCPVGGAATALLLALTVPALPQDALKQRVDPEGEPLPAEAIARIGSARLRTTGQLHWLAYTADGKTIVTVASPAAETKGTVQFWDAATGRLRREAAISIGFFTSGFRFDRDGNIAFLDNQGTIHVVDGRSGRELQRRKLALTDDIMPHALPWLDIAPQASLVALRPSIDRVVLFGLKDGKERRRLRIKAEPNPQNIIAGQTVVFSPDTAALAVVATGGRIEVFDPATGQKRQDLAVALKKIDHIAFSPDGRHLLCTGHKQECLLLRDWKGKRDIVSLGTAADWTTAAFAPDGQHLAVAGGQGHVAVHTVATGKEVRRLVMGKHYHGLLAFAPDGQTLATAEVTGAISQWRVATGERLPAAAEPATNLTLGRFTADGKELIAYTNRAVVFSRTSGRLVRDLAPAESQYLGEASLSGDGRLLAVPRGKELLLLDAKSGKELRRLGVAGGYVGRHLFSDKRLFTLGSDRIIRVWDVDTLTAVRELHGAGDSSIWDASPDGRFLAAVPFGQLQAADHDLRLWDVTTGKLRHRFTPRRGGAYQMAFSSDGERLVLVTDQLFANPGGAEVSVIDVRTGSEVLAFPLPQDGVSRIAVSPDGRTLATGDFRAGTLRLWELATGKQRHRFTGHKRPITSFAFSRDSAVLAASSSEAPAFVWDIFGKHADGKAPPWVADEGPRHWQAIAGTDAPAAFQAIRRLVNHPGPAIALVRQQCKPAAPVDARRVQQWLLDLDSDDFNVRQAASTELERLGDRIEAALTKALRGKRSLEAKRRVEAMLAKLDRTTPERLRYTRALEALEQIATPDARRLLEALAAGEPSSWMTYEAAIARDRLRRSASQSD